MQFIGADNPFGFLRYFTVFGGLQLGRDRGVKYIEQHMAQRVISGEIGFIPHKMTYKSFGDRSIHAVH